ncbi:MAG: sugar phosphate nucleotidyltransferase [Clostridiales bacterium]|nr:sugar phosphate nucleotidyltransferase [Clostridiales bacterium]
MAKPVLVVMAAGMGSRYGGMKQIDPITEQGEIIIDFSLYDAMMAGFEEAVFIVKKEIEEDVHARLDDGAGRHMKITYALQGLSDLPPGYAVPEGRVKPWGTCHAVLAAKDLVKGNFCVINADDYYGPQAFRLMYEELLTAEDGDTYDYSMVGYRLANTLTEYGHVSRGVCVLGESGRLIGVDERLKIMWRDRKVMYEDDGEWYGESPDATASMNFWGFTPSFLTELAEGFPAFLDKALAADPMKGEYLLPRKVDELVKEGKASVKVLKTDERWFGITYKEDKGYVTDFVNAMKDKGVYPETLWGEIEG